MSEKFKMVGDVKVMQGTKVYELLESKDPAAPKQVKRLMEYSRKAEACCYDWATLQKLRKEFQDVM